MLFLAACSTGGDGDSLEATDGDAPILLIEADGPDLSPGAADKPVLIVTKGGTAVPAASVSDAPPAVVAPSVDVEANTTPLVIAVEPEPEPQPAPQPVGSDVPLIIFDSDLGPDIDDALALAMIHGYQELGMAELAAVTISRNAPTSARFADAVNTFYGRPDIPIGIGPGDSPYFSDDLTYASLANSWSHDLNGGNIESAVRVHRRALAGALAANRPVIIIQVGFASNLADLLASPGDDISPLSGRDLVAQSGAVLSAMAGSIEYGIVEFNVEKDISSANAVVSQWPGKLILSPFELGYNLHYPYSSIQQDFGWADRHPVVEAYVFRDLSWHEDAPPFYNMRTWDLTSVMEAIEPEQGYFRTTGPGTVNVTGSGHTSFSSGSGQHRVLHQGASYSSQERNRAVARMIELVSAPT